MKKKKPLRYTRGSLQHWQLVALYLGLYDAMTVAFSYFAAVYIRFDLHLNLMLEEFGAGLGRFLLIYVPVVLVIYSLMKLYNSIWRFASYVELEKIFKATLLSVLSAVLIAVAFSIRLPVSAYVMGTVLQMFFACMIRFSYRFVLLMRKIRDGSQVTKKKTMIIGAGAAGQMLERDARKSSDSNFEVCCFIDDNPNKHHRTIDQIPVVGGRDIILQTAKMYEIEVILFAITKIPAEEKRDLLNICQETGCEIRVLPSLIQLAEGTVSIGSLQEIRMEDLLGRDPIQVDTGEILASVSNKTILVTGGGGSIGSELCRQIASHNPKQLLIVDIYENNAYDIQQELLRKYPDLNLKVLIASVRDTARINQIFDRYRPQIVFHAAAHKHVPLMETSPCEAVKNNVFGTYKTARAALDHGAEKFVLISTDKAVNPTNIMGCTKRICEMIIQTMNEEAARKATWSLPVICHDHTGTRQKLDGLKTQFVAVRFGNVLGSNGSVIPLFKKQIEAGGPVTVTHPDIVRYFMTIQEAVSLVLEAAAYAHGGEIFVLDMGEPMKIDDLAKNLIRMSGKTPGEDIEIKYTGLRPGEKLYEEKLMAEEGLEKTSNKLIHIGKPIQFDRDRFLEMLPVLYDAAMENDEANLLMMVTQLVKTYSPDWKSFKGEGLNLPERLQEKQQPVSIQQKLQA